MPKCDQCGREFSTDAALAQHVQDKHGAGAQPTSPGVRAEGEARAPKKQKPLRKGKSRARAYAVIAVVVALGLGVYFVTAPALAGPPFACITNENWIHVHPYLVIDIEGKNVTIPNGVGNVEGGTCLQPVHTHDASGVIHIELSQSDSQGHSFTLGDFFSIWKYTADSVPGTAPVLNGVALPVEFSATDIFGFQTNSTYHVVLLVDGQPSSQWGSLNLEQLDYCSAARTGPPCNGTGDPLWDGGAGYPYGTGHTIVIEYVRA